MKAICYISVLVLLIGFAGPGFAITPDREYIRTPDSVAWNYEQLSIKTKDHLERKYTQMITMVVRTPF